MILKDTDGREVQCAISGDPEKPLIESGIYIDNGQVADEPILSWLQDSYYGEIGEELVQHAITKAKVSYGVYQ